ncbi:nitrite reductase small subunit NirD [Thauera terpenica]
MSTFQRACSAAELHSKGQLGLTIGSMKLALFKVGEKFVATNGLCPHADGPLAEGEVDGDLVTCPWHGWSFCLKTGVSPDDEAMVLQLYEVRVEGDDVLVALPA